MIHNSQSPATTPVIEVKQSQLQKRLSHWRLWLPLLLQIGLVLAIPAQAVYIQVTGKTIVLKTIPVDPYDFLRGYSQTLGYDISRQDTLRSLPGWQELVKQPIAEKSTPLPLSSDYLASGTKFYVVLEAPSVASHPPQPWKPVRVSRDRPTVSANQVALQGKFTGNLVEYGLETYYMPESRQHEINRDIRQVQTGRQQQSVVVEAKVDNRGRALPMSFWISDHHYRF